MKNFTFCSKVILLAFTFFLLTQSSNAQATVTGSEGLPIGTSINGVAYGNSVYVAVGASGYILKSTNATSWTVVKNSSFLNTTYNKVAFGGGLFAAVTSDGKILTSSDGDTWTQQTSGTTAVLNDIVYANSMFFVAGNGNTALTSTNGTTWTSLSIGTASADDLMNVVYAQGKFVVGVRDAATSGSKSFYSTTGAVGTWSNVTIASAGNSLNRISFLNNKFFCFTSSTNIYSSTDGVSWSSFVNATLTTPNQVFHGFYDGTKYYMFGSSSTYGYGSVFTSTDGSTFTLQPQSTTLVAQYSAYLNGKYFQVGNEGLVSSSDGSTWRFPAGSYNALATSGTRYVAVGQVTSNEAAIYTSADWNTWSNSTPSVFKPLNGVTYGNSKFIAVGNTDASGFGTIATSSDGLSWTIGNSGVADNLRSVAYGNSKYVAVGFNGRIIYSSDGTSWTSAESVSGYNYYGVAYVNNYFVAVGGSPTVTTGMTKVKYSSNGITWTDVSPSIVGHFHSIAYGGGKYLLVGRDNTSGSLKFFSVTTNDITSGAAGYSSAATVTTPEGDVGTTGLGSVTYNNSTFLAVSNLRVSPFSAYILTSSTGSSWVATSASTTGRLRSVISDGTAFKVVGTMDTRLSVSAGTPLPLDLIDFSSRNNDRNVILSWKTINEKNTKYFEIERSENGDNFSVIDYILIV